MKAESLRELIGEPVKVVWLDTVSRSEWTTLAKVTAMQPHICVTFGLLMVVTDTHLTLAATSCKPEEDDDDVASDCITLPIGGIAQVTRMTE